MSDQPLNLEITRLFDASREAVFDAWTLKERLDQWTAPHGFTILYSEGDLRPGGEWRCCMVAPDGTKHPVSGVYREIIEDEFLSFTHAWEDAEGKRGHDTLVTVRLEDAPGGKTKMIFRQGAFDSVESRDGHAGGWGEALEKLESLLSKA
jgi:uncharacterized protein YndB with AHSA1/START domain